MWRVSVSSEENNEVNAKKIAEKYIYGIKWRPAHVGIKELIFIPRKSTIYLNLESFFLELNKGSWGLDACHHLIGGLNQHLVQGQLSRNVITLPDTCSAAVTIATHPCQVPLIPTSCECTKCIMPAAVSERIQSISLPLQPAGPFMIDWLALALVSCTTKKYQILPRWSHGGLCLMFRARQS